jgi:hypothetical protein
VRQKATGGELLMPLEMGTIEEESAPVADETE